MYNRNIKRDTKFFFKSVINFYNIDEYLDKNMTNYTNFNNF